MSVINDCRYNVACLDEEEKLFNGVFGSQGFSKMAGGQQLPEQYTVPQLARVFHSLPHLNVSLHSVNNTFNPHSEIYLEKRRRQRVRERGGDGSEGGDGDGGGGGNGGGERVFLAR
ncbi:protein tweety isoform X5 [Vespula squamosa]|uniref:Protein tweety isoform X5 n=1 Tax=Vespula squamosa TaxID=30214 RepID=A0ABD2A650_VESSQ